MNAILKPIIYVILLISHMFGAFIATIIGIAGCAMVLVGAGQTNLTMVLSGLIIAVVAIILQRFFIWIDPSYMYYEEDW